MSSFANSKKQGQNKTSDEQVLLPHRHQHRSHHEMTTSPKGEPQLTVCGDVIYNEDDQGRYQEAIDFYFPMPSLFGEVVVDIHVPIPDYEDETVEVFVRTHGDEFVVNGRVSRSQKDANHEFVIASFLGLCILVNIPVRDDAQHVSCYVKPLRSQRSVHRA